MVLDVDRVGQHLVEADFAVGISVGLGVNLDRLAVVELAVNFGSGHSAFAEHACREVDFSTHGNGAAADLERALLVPVFGPGLFRQGECGEVHVVVIQHERSYVGVGRKVERCEVVVGEEQRVEQRVLAYIHA